jgi:hypothetical protein
MKYPDLKLECDHCRKPLKYLLGVDKKTIVVHLCEHCIESYREKAFSDGYKTAGEDE